MNMLQADYNLVKAKKAYVRITNERNCVKCHRKIGDKVFVVYPDGTTIHSTCASSAGNTSSSYSTTKKHNDNTYKY